MKSYTWLMFFFIRLSSGLDNYQVNVTFFRNSTKKVHLTVLEYQDLFNRRGRLDIQSGQEITKYYYYAEPWQVVSFSEKGECRVDKTSSNDFYTKFSFFGWRYSNIHVRGPSAVFFRNTTESPLWKSKVRVRGISCDEYEAFDMDNPKIQITTYFIAPPWENPFSLIFEATVRISILFGSVRSVWDFMHFKIGGSDLRAFQIPTGIGCENFVTRNKPRLPDFSPRYSFVAEMKDPTNSSLINWKVLYDTRKKIMQIKEAQNDDTFKEIQDFNTGFLYRINRMGECNITSVKNSLSEKHLRDLVAVMKDPKEMLKLDESAYYIGKDELRGLQVDIWETIQENKDFWKVHFKKVVITFYYTQIDVHVVSEGRENTKVPVMIKISPHFDDPIFQVVGSFEIHFFDFHKKSYDQFYSEVSVENCFTEDTKRDVFLLSFLVDTMQYETAIRQAKMFENSVALAIRNVLSISPLRLKIIKSYYEPGLIVVRGMLFEKTPSIKGFYIPEDNRYVPNVGNEPKISGLAENDCAVQCIVKLTNACTGFTACPGLQSKYDCYLTTVTDIDNWPKHIETPGCKYYARSVYSDVFEDMPLKSATHVLHGKVVNHTLKIYLRSEAGKLVTYHPIQLETGMKLDRPKQLGKFVKVLDNHQLEHSVSLKVMEKVVSTGECSKMCLEDIRVPCASFSFCHNTHECLFSSHYIQKGKEHGKSVATSCEVYHRNAIEFFDKMKGKSSGTEGKVSVNKESPEECALACQDETSFDCRGFDYCPEEKTCSLSEVHQLDLPTLSESSSCVHYSRKFSFDFEPKGQHMIKAEGRSFEFEVKSVEECAKLCIDHEKDFTCKSFSLCVEEKSVEKCWINMDTVDHPGVKIDDGLPCLYYESKPQAGVVLEVIDELVSNQSYDATLSCLFFLGIALGAAVYFSYSYLGKKEDQAANAAVHYSQAAQEEQTAQEQQIDEEID